MQTSGIGDFFEHLAAKVVSYCKTFVNKIKIEMATCIEEYQEGSSCDVGGRRRTKKRCCSERALGDDMDEFLVGQLTDAASIGDGVRSLVTRGQRSRFLMGPTITGKLCSRCLVPAIERRGE
jgi:hypothetical protein